ncbi:MAG: murein biosynthesis integral membrane protein MurJ [Pseudomonadota bacterium]
MGDSLGKKIGVASLIMMASVFLSRVIGLFREMAIAYIGGATAAVDAYQVAFIIPEILNHVVASGFLSITFIPIFSRYLAKADMDGGWGVFSDILVVFGGFLSVLTTAAWIAAPQLVAILAPGLKDPATRQLAVEMTRIILPAQVFFFAGGLLMAVQYASAAFVVPALAPLAYNAGIIAGGLLLGPWLGMQGFAWGVLGGAFIGNFALQWVGARRLGMRFCPRFNLGHPDFRRYILVSLPLILGLTMTFSTEVFLKFFGSFLPAGSIAALNYGLRVVFMLVGIFGQAIGVAAFPFMSRLAAENKVAEMNDLLNRSLRYLALLIPFSILLMVLRREVVVILFQHGRFDAAAVQHTADTLLWLLMGAFAFAAQTVVVRGYYAMQDTLFPSLYGSFAVVASLPLYIVGMRFYGLSGVAAAISLSAAFQVSLLFVLWNRRSGNSGAGGVFGACGRLAVVGGGIGAVVWAGKEALWTASAVQGKLHSMMVVGIVSLVYVLVLAAVGKLTGIAEISQGLALIRTRLTRR